MINQSWPKDQARREGMKSSSLSINGLKNWLIRLGSYVGSLKMTQKVRAFPRFYIKIGALKLHGEAERCPEVDEFADTATTGLPPLPSQEAVNKIFTTILFLHITTSKQYSAYTRAFFAKFEPHLRPDENAIVKVLKNPETVGVQVQPHTEAMRNTHVDRSYMSRIASIGLGAVAGGVLIGVTGGLAAPLVAAGLTSIFGWFGLSGTAIGLMATGLAGSPMICGALFGAYGAKSTGEMVERYIREVRDLAIVPVRIREGGETLGIRLCVSGWLTDESDVHEPWNIFKGDDTFALQWVSVHYYMIPVYFTVTSGDRSLKGAIRCYV